MKGKENKVGKEELGNAHESERERGEMGQSGISDPQRKHIGGEKPGGKAKGREST